MYIAGGPTVLFAPTMVVDRYEPGTNHIFKSLVREGMTVIDVGAHVGYYTLLAARLVGSGGRVYAFEADPATCELLRRNIALNRYRNIVVFNCAVSNFKGRAHLFMNRATSSGASRWNRIYQLGENDRGIPVPSTTLDDFLRSEGNPPVHLVKIDVDGGEMRVLDGMIDLLGRERPPRLIMEFYPEGLRASGVDPSDLPARLFQVGFRIFIIKNGKSEGQVELEEVRAPRLLVSTVEPGGTVNVLCERN